MRLVREIIQSKVLVNFAASPRLTLGALIFFAGTTLLLIEAIMTAYG